MFSWQKNDFEQLYTAFNAGGRILFVHGKDFESPYHVLTSFYTSLSKQEYMLFEINMLDAHISYPLLPFAHAIRQSFGYAKKPRSLLPVIVKDITHSDTASSIVERIINERNFSVALNKHETDLMSQMEYVADGFIPVFSFRGYPHFDINSQDFTRLLASGLLNDDFPFLKNAKFLFVCEDEGSSATIQEIQQLEHTDVFLTEPRPKDMAEILAEFCPALHLTPYEQEKMYYLSGGRLSIIEFLSRYLASKGSIAVDGSAQDAIDATLTERISHMGNIGTTLEYVLEFAANIGNTFHIPLLKQVVNRSDCDAVLERSDQEFFTKCAEDSGKFVCREIRDFFFSCPDEKRKRDIAFALERAIYYFDPYDYLTRAYYMEQAKEQQNSCELYFLAYNSIIQDGLIPGHDLENKIGILSAQCGLKHFWDSLRKIYDAMNNLNYKSCIEILEAMEIPPTVRLLLLKEYLTGLCLHRLGNTADHQREAMLSIQAAAEHAKNVEDGIWCDCQMALLSYLVNSSGDIFAAQRICKELTYYYTTKNHALFAQKGLNALKRKWSALYSVEMAVSKTESSVLFFKNGLYPSQYLMALNNHAANLIVLGNYVEAIKYLNDAICAIQKYQPTGVNRMYLLSNYCLCAVLSGKMSPADACKSLLPIIDHGDYGDWTIIPQLNYAIYMALAGEIVKAEEKLRELEKVCLAICDDYYLFYVYANLASVFYLQGKREEAVHVLQNHCLKSPALFKTTEKTYIEERTRQWISTMESIEIKDINIFDTYLLNKHPDKTQWAFIGRGFLYSDIQFWSEP